MQGREETVLDVLAEVSGRARAEIRPEMDLVVDLSIDSPQALRLLVELEEKLQVEISDEDAAGMNTVDDILRYVRTHDSAAS
jgi:acyl carrier protein